MRDNYFYELAVRKLSGNLTESEKEKFQKCLQKQRYQQLFNILEQEWNRTLRTGSADFNLEHGLSRLRVKMSKEKEVTDNGKKVILRRRIVQLAAAVLVLLVSMRIVLQLVAPSSGIVEYARNNTQDIKRGDTRLILNDEKEIRIENKESQIDYSSGKGLVVVDEKKTIQQDEKEHSITYNTVIVPYGKRSKITLADHTEVWLNSGSRLIYPTCFASDKREVFLEGEALFDVAHNHDKPFVVRTSNINVKVLGTVFNVKAYNDDVLTETVLEKGSVEIACNGNNLLGHSHLRITPGTLAEYNVETKEIDQKKVDPRYYTSWHNGFLFYQGEPLVEILKELSRYYNRTIMLENEPLGEDTFSGKLDLKNDVEKVLETIAFVSSLEIEERNNILIIKK